VNESASIVDKLHHVLEEDDGLADRLERSLVEAHARAQSELNRAVFAALDWPTDLAAYDKYLQGFLRWIPQQRSGPPRSSSRHDTTAWAAHR
jgi:phosphatidylserine decarboxylase